MAQDIDATVDFLKAGRIGEYDQLRKIRCGGKSLCRAPR